MLKKLRSIFIVDEDPTSQAGNSEQESAIDSAGTSSEPDFENNTRATVKVRGGEVNEKFLNVLLDALDKNDLDGFDYLEFKRFLNSLDKVDLDEATRFRTAFATGETMGASKALLVSSTQQYVEILKREEARFEQAVQNQRSKVIDDRQAGIVNLEKVIRERQEQIEKLTKAVVGDKAEIERLKGEITEAQSKIQETAVDFQHAYQHLLGQLNEDLGKIKKYIA